MSALTHREERVSRTYLFIFSLHHRHHHKAVKMAALSYTNLTLSLYLSQHPTSLRLERELVSVIMFVYVCPHS